MPGVLGLTTGNGLWHGDVGGEVGLSADVVTAATGDEGRHEYAATEESRDLSHCHLSYPFKDSGVRHAGTRLAGAHRETAETGSGNRGYGGRFRTMANDRA
jgi:hypothetical protein